MKKKLILLSRILLAGLFLMVVSCKKNADISPETLKQQKWANEIYLNMQQIYLWNDALPATFDSTKYTAQSALDYLISLKINPTTGQPIDRYSFLDKIGNLSGQLTTGTASGDYGFMVVPAYNLNNQVSFYVNYVYKNSPAGLSGVQRSYEITKINGSTAVHPGIDNQGYLDTASVGYKNMVNALFYSSTASFTFTRNDGTTLDATLSTNNYSINSVLFDSIYTLANNSKAGYVVFNQFLGTPSETELSAVINYFQTNGVSNIIVDLRYNGGGSVSTSEYFCNLLVPSSATGNVMYKYKMNNPLTQYYISQNYDLSTYIKKEGTFQPQKIYFIVSSRTASASELLINNLRPYYTGNIYLIGETTYGKPCGFWTTPIGYTDTQTTPKEGYDLYAISFETVNANNQGGYYTGMTPGSTDYPGITAHDSFFLPWGDPTDGCLSEALYHLQNGAFKVRSISKSRAVNTTPFSTIDRQFNGMIDFRKHFRTNL